jgi:hypothetical protein
MPAAFLRGTSTCESVSIVSCYLSSSARWPGRENMGTDGTFTSFLPNEQSQKMGYVPSVPGFVPPVLSPKLGKNILD